MLLYSTVHNLDKLAVEWHSSGLISVNSSTGLKDISTLAPNLDNCSVLYAVKVNLSPSAEPVQCGKCNFRFYGKAKRFRKYCAIRINLWR